jgi:hypothetical protein
MYPQVGELGRISDGFAKLLNHALQRYMAITSGKSDTAKTGKFIPW